MVDLTRLGGKMSPYNYPFMRLIITPTEGVAHPLSNVVNLLVFHGLGGLPSILGFCCSLLMLAIKPYLSIC